MNQNTDSKPYNDRETSRGRYDRYGDDASDALFNGEVASNLADRAFRKANAEYRNADPDKPVKLFGIEMDPMTARFAKMGYNFASDYGTQYLAPHAYRITTNLVRPHASADATIKTAALTTTAINIALKSGGFIWEMIDNARDSRKKKGTLARDIANALDDIKGKHSIGALNSVTLEQNSVVHAHVKRLDKQYAVIFKNGLIDVTLNAGPNLLLNAQQARGMWAGADPKTLSDQVSGKMKDVVRFLTSGTTAEITEQMKKNSTRRLDKSLSAYSTLQMIQALAEQVDHNPHQRTFQVPGKRGEAYELEEYVMRAVIHHYKELSDLSPDYTEVREGLRNELAAAVKPIAEAIRKGDLSTMELVHLIGEGKIVQRNGRVIATVEEIRDAIHQGSHEHATSRIHESPEAHYARASYNRDELKKTLHTLEGDEKQAFASLLSDEVLEDAGMKKADIKELHDQTASANDNDRTVAALVLGTTAQGADALKQTGSASSEIAQLEQAGKKIAHDGLQAVHGLRSTANHADGIEHSLINSIVARQQTNKDYLSEILARGDEQVAHAGQGRKVATSHRDRLAQEGHSLQAQADTYR